MNQLLENCIQDNAPGFYPTLQAPNSYTDLKEWAEQNDYHALPMPVFSGGSEDTIYSTPDINYAFRAWHDSIHLEQELDFTTNNELAVASIHYREVLKYGLENGYPLGECVTAARLIYADVAGQVMYYDKYGDFVKDQEQFVNEFLDGLWFDLED